MQPFSNTSFPLSFAQLDSTVYREPRSTRPAAACPDSRQAHMLAALCVRSAEVESAEWALDQSLQVRNEQIMAALSAGIPAEKVSAATGLTASELEHPAEARTPRSEEVERQ
ncbi:hypothetical protein [Arthrobacter sp. USHLN218]|uniref:hypothetical protein n=1 Tax=Arthrobacter sp. USHLN218 TaxID=3081232 RepID=UPI00301ADADE